MQRAAVTSSRQVGTVVWFNDKLGSGLVRNERGRFFRVHYKDIVHPGHRTLLPGEQVELQLECSGDEAAVISVRHAPSRPPWQHVRSRLVARLIRAMIRRRSVRYMWTIKGGILDVSMVRYYLLRTPFVEIYLH